jgi:hypothetical protein
MVALVSVHHAGLVKQKGFFRLTEKPLKDLDCVCIKILPSFSVCSTTTTGTETGDDGNAWGKDGGISHF